MSRFLTKKDDGTYLEEIESMEVCKWRINELCCNYKSEYLGEFYCNDVIICNCFEKEDGIIKESE